MYNTRKEVENWLKKMRIKNYVVHEDEDLTVDVDGNVDISDKNLKEIPIRFGKVNGYFYCYHNKLSSLEGCPKEIKGNFSCHNNKLTNLKGCPEEIDGDFDCYNNNLTSLDYFPKKINGEDICISENKIKEEELVNFHCDIKNIKEIYSDFNKYGDKEKFLEKVRFYKIKRENELLKELNANSNGVKLNKKL